MTTYLLDELATEALRSLGVLGSEEEPSAADMEDAKRSCRSEVLQMNSRGIPIWNGSEIDIPEEYFTVLARHCAISLSPKYGLSDIATVPAAMETSEVNLRRLGSVGPTGVTQTAEYY